MIYFLKWCISKNFLKYWNWQDEKTRQSCHSSRKEKKPEWNREANEAKKDWYRSE